MRTHLAACGTQYRGCAPLCPSRIADEAEDAATKEAREEGRQEEWARCVARLERLCREAPTDPIGFACHFAIAVQDIRSGKGAS